jgi:hypothetical protein
MINENVLICGVVKNCEDKLDFNIKKSIETGKLFKNSHIIIYENNSEDTTKNLLNKYKDNPILL